MKTTKYINPANVKVSNDRYMVTGISDTPRTDALVEGYDEDGIAVELCRKIERELETATSELNTVFAQARVAQLDNARLERKLFASHAECARLREALGFARLSINDALIDNISKDQLRRDSEYLASVLGVTP